ncbi:hypothetical protein AA0229_0697 [Gluconobacter cerinus NRIC 0229]|uniref:Uncharacterized protein n=1 Tax=Gluconobacter cerinus TaxID=38307 RepID=A0AAV5NIJ5_9PROT|nr:hypothetical protein AA0229_0697 [Gluconobacter cerinus NRIC 0229]GLQ64257.1 hypothetical protein GCM10007867_31040 [Gluconobacter cerinus]
MMAWTPPDRWGNVCIFVITEVSKCVIVLIGKVEAPYEGAVPRQIAIGIGYTSKETKTSAGESSVQEICTIDRPFGLHVHNPA